MSPQTALQRAIFARLSGDPGVRAIFGHPARIWDAARADPQTPFAVIARIETKPAGVIGADALDHVVQIHVFVRDQGRAGAQDALNAVARALDDADLALEGFRLVMLFALYLDVFQTPQPGLFQGVVRFKAVTEPNS